MSHFDIADYNYDEPSAIGLITNKLNYNYLIDCIDLLSQIRKTSINKDSNKKYEKKVKKPQHNIDDIFTDAKKSIKSKENAEEKPEPKKADKNKQTQPKIPNTQQQKSQKVANEFNIRNYIYPKKGFYYPSAIKDKFNLKINVPSIDDSEAFELKNSLEEIIKLRGTYFAVDVWFWCVEEFYQFRRQVDEFDSTSLFDDIIDMTSYNDRFSDEFVDRFAKGDKNARLILSKIQYDWGLDGFFASCFKTKNIELIKEAFKTVIKNHELKKNDICLVFSNLISDINAYDDFKFAYDMSTIFMPFALMKAQNNRILQKAEKILNKKIKEAEEAYQNEKDDEYDEINEQEEEIEKTAEDEIIDEEDNKIIQEYHANDQSDTTMITAYLIRIDEVDNSCYYFSKNALSIGDRVTVPYGKDNKKLNGTVKKILNTQVKDFDVPIEAMKYICKQETEELKEEQIILNKIIDTTNIQLNEIIKNGDYIEKRINDIGNNDLEDRYELYEQRRLQHSNEEKQKNIENLQNKPYFQHIELKSQDIKKEFLVGNESFSENGITISTWTNPLVRRIESGYTKFNYGNKNYELILNRSVLIDNKQLISTNTKYQDDQLISKEVSDSFLIEIIKRNGYKYKLTNIIETIQKNQNDIIIKNVKESFAIQGCAGSGKTMILLHRLSYLLANHMIDANNTCIITPSQNFNSNISELGKELKIDKIKRYTFEKFLLYLLKSLINNDDNAQNFSENLNNVVRNEKSFSQKMMIEVYSDKFQNQIISNYQKFLLTIKNNYSKIIDECNKIQFNKNYKINDLPNKLSFTYDDYRKINYFIFVSQREHAEAIRIDNFEKSLNSKEIELLKRLETIRDYIKCDNLFSKYELEIKKVYEIFKCEYNDQRLYRHILYLKLLFASSYYQKAWIENFINIDEAQNIASCEYSLIKNVLGQKCTFNLYGDINQAIVPYNKINNWKQLKKLNIINDILYLNQNYRNTIQIGNYCNKKFNYNFDNIGINGDIVKEEVFDKAIIDLVSQINKNKKMRYAIIYSQSFKNVKNKISKYKKIYGNIFSYINVLSVDNAKGIEFEYVIVITNKMTTEEKYVAFTRARNNLIVSHIEEKNVKKKQN